MDSRRKRLENCRLYAILDKRAVGDRPLWRVALQLASGGIDIVQVRDKGAPRATVLKEAVAVRRALAGSGVLTIVNDYPDIALQADCDGVHLGQDDVSVALARRIVGPDRIIGVSCHSLKQARQAESDGADYIGIGPVMATPTKPDYAPIGTGVLRKVARALKIPFFAIGNINRSNVRRIARREAWRFAVCRDFVAGADAAAAVRGFSEVLHL